MARPKKETVEYFPHYVSSGKTMFILENNFGNDGYSFWFKLLELLGSTDGHVYDCRNTSDWEFLLAKTRVSDETASRILEKLASLDAIDKDLWQIKLIWSDNFVKNLLPVYSNRKSSLPKKPILTSSNNDTSEFLPVKPQDIEVSTGENTHSKVEESKVKESKVEKDNSLSLDNQSIELCKYFETLLPGQSITKHSATLKIYIELYTYDWCKDAMQKTIKNTGKFVPNYMERILKDWTKEGRSESSGSSRQDNKSSTTEGYDFSGLGG